MTLIYSLFIYFTVVTFILPVTHCEYSDDRIVNARLTHQFHNLNSCYLVYYTCLIAQLIPGNSHNVLTAALRV